MQLPIIAPGKRYTLPRPVGSADALLLARLAQGMTDEQIDRLKRGGHDIVKIHAAYAAAAAHHDQPAVILAHACEPPTEICTTPDPPWVTATGVLEVLLDPFPSCPLVPAPQHFAAPLLVTAQTVFDPAEIFDTPDVRPVTDTGVELCVRVPLPS